MMSFCVEDRRLGRKGAYQMIALVTGAIRDKSPEPQPWELYSFNLQGT